MIVLLAHGSPDARHDRGVQVLAHQVGEILAPTPVAVAYLQHHGPTLVSAVAEVTADVDGSRVWVLPLLLSGGVHVRDDVPELLSEARAARPDLDWRLLPTLPPATLSLAVLESLTTTPATGVGVIAVVAGTSVPGALDGFESLAASLRPAGVEVVFANGPGEIGSAHTLLAALGHEAPEVLPLMFADGFLADLAARRAAEAGLVAARPIGERIESAHAVASWVAAHVLHTTSAPVGARRERVGVAG